MNIEKALLNICVDVISAHDVELAYFKARAMGDTKEQLKLRKLNDALKLNLKKKAESTLNEFIQVEDNQLKLVQL